MLKPAIPLLLSSALFACSSAQSGDDIKDISSPDRLSANEWVWFANQLQTSLTQAGTLQRYKGPQGEPVPLMIGDFNNTAAPEFMVSKDIMQNELRKALVNSGQAQVMMDAGGTGAQIDKSVGSVQDLHGSTAYDQSTLPEAGQFVGPKLTLNGQFIRVGFVQGRTTEVDYACAVRLIDNRTALTVWEEQITFPKQYTRGFPKPPMPHMPRPPMP